MSVFVLTLGDVISLVILSLMALLIGGLYALYYLAAAWDRFRGRK